jgi:pyruvate dehydrogenase E2 component (dihydrolipoamide acetyltransferase)
MSFEFHLPDIGEGVIEGEIVSWKVKEGDVVDLDQPIVEVMTDKATVEIPSPRAGTISKINFQEGEICPVGDVLLVIDDGGATAPAPTAGGNGQPVEPRVPTQAVAPQVIDATGDRTRVKATPATRRLAREKGVDLTQVQGTGRNGRITTADVEAFASGAVAQAVPAAGSAPAAVARPAAPPVSVPVTELEERIPFRGMRKRIAENMSRSKFTATHFTYVEEVDVTELVELRARAKERAADRNISLTYLPFIIKAVVAGLKKWPALNAALDETTQEIVRKKYYHMGIAAQGPQGLAVTVLRDADKRSIFDIAAELHRLGQAVQDGTASRDDLTGSTFTITSLGKLGGVLATPIINFPEVGILGVHKIAERPAVVNGEIVIRSLMNLSISLDHRLVDGWDGAMFLQDVKALLEDPTLMFMEMR